MPRGKGRRRMPPVKRNRQEQGKSMEQKLNSFNFVPSGNPVSIYVILSNALIFSLLALVLPETLLYYIYIPNILMSLVRYQTFGEGVVTIHGCLHYSIGFLICLLLPPYICSLVQIFLFTSMILRYFPQLKRGSPMFPPSSKPRIIGHRIGAGEGIENTVEAYESVKDSVWGIQVDVLETKDKQVVLFHDQRLEKNFERLTGKEGQIKDFNMGDLPPFNDEVKVTAICDFGQKPFDGKGKSIDSFGTLLKSIENEESSPLLQVEMWDPSPSLVEQTYKLLEKSERLNHLVWGNPSDNKIAALCQKISPTTPRIVTFSEWIGISMLHYFYILPFVPLRDNLVFNIAVFTDRLRELVSTTFGSSIWRWPFITFIWPIMEWFYTSHTLVDHLKRRNVPVFVFICNDEKDFAMAQEFSPDAILTDYPSRLQSFLSSTISNDFKELETNKKARA